MTLTRSIMVRGIGLHTGAACSVTLSPSDQTGIFFYRGNARIPASTKQVVDTSRCTVLGAGGVTVSTVEHLLSACAGLGLTALLVEVDGPELPIGDGSASLWTEAILDAGIDCDSVRTMAESIPILAESVEVTGKEGQFIAAYPSDILRLTVAITFPHPLVGTQIARYEPSRGDNYARDIAPSRTFGFIEEVEALRKAGLAQGGSFDNAVVVYPDHYSTPLRSPNELARHKLLDVMGDMALCGFTKGLRADIIAVKPSHRLNVAFAAKLAEACCAGFPA